MKEIISSMCSETLRITVGGRMLREAMSSMKDASNCWATSCQGRCSVWARSMILSSMSVIPHALNTVHPNCRCMMRRRMSNLRKQMAWPMCEWSYTVGPHWYHVSTFVSKRTGSTRRAKPLNTLSANLPQLAIQLQLPKKERESVITQEREKRKTRANPNNSEKIKAFSSQTHTQTHAETQTRRHSTWQTRERKRKEEKRTMH